MKANELMIGDWVDLSEMPNESIPCKVVELHTEELLEIQPDDTACDIVGYDDIKPIPLTAEILEKNGIKKRGYEYVVFGWDGAKQWHVALEDFKPQFDFWFITSFYRDLNVRGQIRYVHELQRLLRCCGLNELADNFMV